MTESSFQDQSPVEPPVAGEDPPLDDSEGRDRFDLDEVRSVLQRFPISGITTIREFHAGSRRSPKILISTDGGDYLLKRRAPRPDLLQRVNYNHAIIQRLQDLEHPVARLISLRDNANTAAVRGEDVYELFEYVEGRRFDHSPAEVQMVGRVLGGMHHALEGWHPEGESPKGTYHSADTVFTALDRLVKAIVAVDPSVSPKEVDALARNLRAMYQRAVRKAEEAGWASLAPQPIHGDWHPGNVVFLDAEGGGKPGRVAAVVDFDSSRAEPRVIDLANGLLHFAMRSHPGKSPSTWPHELSSRRLAALISGWVSGVSSVMDEEAAVVPWLMVEAAIAESVVPVAETGCFSRVPGFPFLQMVRAKTEWIAPRAKGIQGLFKAT
ncbi:MAG: phosphotransferase [Phycisphaerales bacterium]|nr:phosphotransferase [Phycisphaerales bacterium]